MDTGKVKEGLNVKGLSGKIDLQESKTFSIVFIIFCFSSSLPANFKEKGDIFLL